MVARKQLGSGAVGHGFQEVVLLVEDDPALRAQMRETLEEEGYWVDVAADFHGAVRLLQTLVPDVVCVDTTLPRESGFELCEWLRRSESHKFVPIIVTSDRGSPEDMAHAEEVGGNAFLKKPYGGDRLLKYVRAVLDGALSSRKSVRSLSKLV